MSTSDGNYISSPFGSTQKMSPVKKSKDSVNDKKTITSRIEKDATVLKNVQISTKRKTDLQSDKAQLIVQKKLTRFLLEELIYSINHYALMNRNKIDDVRVPFLKEQLNQSKEDNDGKLE